MSDVTNRLSAAISPVTTAKVYNPIRSEYYLKNAVEKAPEATPEPTDTSGVKVTLSDEAKAALTLSKDK